MRQREKNRIVVVVVMEQFGVPRVLEIQLIKVCTGGRCCIKKPAINIRIIVEGLIAFRLE